MPANPPFEPDPFGRAIFGGVGAIHFLGTPQNGGLPLSFLQNRKQPTNIAFGGYLLPGFSFLLKSPLSGFTLGGRVSIVLGVPPPFFPGILLSTSRSPRKRIRFSRRRDG